MALGGARSMVVMEAGMRLCTDAPLGIGIDEVYDYVGHDDG